MNDRSRGTVANFPTREFGIACQRLGLGLETGLWLGLGFEWGTFCDRLFFAANLPYEWLNECYYHFVNCRIPGYWRRRCNECSSKTGYSHVSSSSVCWTSTTFLFTVTGKLDGIACFSSWSRQLRQFSWRLADHVRMLLAFVENDYHCTYVAYNTEFCAWIFLKYITVPVYWQL